MPSKLEWEDLGVIHHSIAATLNMIFISNQMLDLLITGTVDHFKTLNLK